MQKFLKVVFIILILSFIICIHEMGHFFACKLFSIHTPIFSIGFGPSLLQKKIGTTTFQLAALPLGGYVSMNSADLEKIPYWQKILITLAGIFNNFVLAYLLLFLLFFFNRMRFKPIINRVKKGSPAEQSDIQSNDRIVRINDILIDSNTELLLQMIQTHPDQDITLTIDRNGSILDIPLSIKRIPVPGGFIGYTGIILQKDPNNRLSIFTVGRQAFKTLSSMMRKTFYLITGFLKPHATTSINPMNNAYLAQKNFQKLFSILMFFIALMSIELGVFNVLPIPFLDGGQAFIYTLEMLTGGLSSAVINFIYIVLLVIFVLLLNRRQRLKKQ